MTVWFVSRHPGAVEWARTQALTVDRWVPHLEPEAVQAGDIVAGTLPVHMAAAVCARGARYLHMSLTLPPAWRGRELSRDELEMAGARLDEFTIEAAPGPVRLPPATSS